MALSPQERSRRMRLNMLMAMSYAVAGRSAFTPLSLFSAGEVGAWYDPSDFSTMFQDSAGTTPVTAVEQPVGLIRDKSGRGNHASQTTSTSRPVLSARVNLLMYSEQFDNAYWNKSASSIIANATTAPDGATTADKLVESATLNWHGFYKEFTAASGQTWSICLKAGERTYAQILDPTDGRLGLIAVNLSSGTVTQNTLSIPLSVSTLGNGWYRVSVTLPALCVSAGATTLDTSTASSIYGSQYTGDGASGVYIWGVDLRVTNTGVNLPAYQRIADAATYNTTGFPYYLKFDGTDDFLVTGTINPGSVDKAQVFAGVRKLSDAAQGILAELSASGANSGMFGIFAPQGTSDYGFRSRGTAPYTPAQTPSNYVPPITNIITCIGDISAPLAQVRLNGSVSVTSTASQGTGNYLSYPLYIGRRGGTSAPYNGHLYGFLVRFSAANLPDAAIVNTETWLNARTGAY